MNRIEAIYSFIDLKDRVVDVGCDQAKLGILLAKRNQKSIASDKSPKVIERASLDIRKLGLDNLIDLRVSNGLQNIKEKEADTLVLSGMGTHTILEILNSTKIKFNKIITISNNYHDILRDKMNELNYKVDKELIIKENNKYYNLILFTKGIKKYSQKELLLGLNQVDSELYKEYLNHLLNKYKTIKKSSKDKNIKIDEMITLIESTI
ncbi:MAG: class I SAM-dependent methyltransferase [Mollicutes bacterium]|nr:class I SAM-dependent methyltransferase [Mollicutes bacterium]